MDTDTSRAGSGTEPGTPVGTGGAEPLVIPPQEHRITEQMIDRDALKVLYRLRDAGYKGWLVGGGVRDLYLGKKPKDFDISTDARPGQLRKIFRNSRTIGRRFRLVQVYFRGNRIIEVSTLRCRGEYDSDDPDEVLAPNNTFGTLEEDAFRRDLTINALFYEVEGGTIIDYVGGVRDLEDGIIRIVGDPARRITRDPVRMLRAIRHAARNGFRVEEATWEAIVAGRDKLSLCPTSRIRDELLKDLRGGAAADWARLAARCGVLGELLPMYADLDPEGEDMDLLGGLLGIADRVVQAAGGPGSTVPALTDIMLFAFLLSPWALRRFDLDHRELKGPAHNQLRQEIRAEIDQLIGERLNLKRMVKEGITTLLVNLPLMEQRRRGGTWPAWLRKKSYFEDCSRFYQMVRARRDGEEVDISALLPAGAAAEEGPAEAAAPQDRGGRAGNGASRQQQQAEPVPERRPQGGRKRGGTRPAFSSAKGGVFGLKR